MFAVALSPSTGDLSSSTEERQHGRRGRYSRSPSPGHSPEKQRSRQRSPVLQKPRSSIDTVADAHRSRRLPRQGANEPKRQQQEYDPEDFNGRGTSHRHRSRSNVHSDEDEDVEGDSRKERSTQRLERTQHNERSSRSSRGDRSRGDRREDVESNRSHRRRCRNFDERGFCIYGDRCKFDHGSDALVVPGTSAWTANFIDTALAATGACLMPQTSSNDTNGNNDGSGDGKAAPSSDQDDIDSSGLPTYNPTPSKFSVLTHLFFIMPFKQF